MFAGNEANSFLDSHIPNQTELDCLVLIMDMWPEKLLVI